MNAHRSRDAAGRCGAGFDVGASRVHGGVMGSIFRCVQCDDVVIRLVRTAAGFRRDMQGARKMFVPAPLD